MQPPSQVHRAILLFALVAQVLTLTGCRTAFAEAPPTLLEPGSSVDLTPETRVSVDSRRPEPDTLIVMLRITALGKAKIDEVFPNVLVTFDVNPLHSDARMDKAAPMVTVWQTLTGNGDGIHQVTVTDARTRKSAQWNLP